MMMDNVLQYLLQSSVIMAIFYVIYFLFLRNERLFKEIRIFLVTSLLLALVLPLIKIPYTVIVESMDNSAVAENILLPGTLGVGEEKTGFELTRSHILLMIYAVVAFVLFILSLVKIFQIYKLVKGKKHKQLEGNKLVLLDEQIPAFTFFGYIVINKEEYHDESLQNILAHEKVHARQKHWIDLLLVEVLSILFWFNPFVWLFQLALKQTHELLADDGVIARGFNIGQYQALLINQLMGAEVVGLANNFNYSINKKRMIMMSKAESPKYKRYKLLLMLPVVVAVLLFNLQITQQVNAQEVEIVEVQKQDQKVVPVVTIRGLVLDSDGQPVPGAAILVTGSTKGTITNMSGEFELMAAKEANLIISFVGHATKKLAVEDFILNGKETDKGYFLKLKLQKEKGMNVTAVTPDGKTMNLRAQYLEIGEKPASKRSFSKTGDEVFIIVEEMPEFPGGQDKLQKYFEEKVVYPEEAKSKGIKGRVFVTFVINKEGEKENVRVVRGVHPYLDKEAVRAVKEMPLWKPGKQRGKPVKVSYTVPVNFGVESKASKANYVKVGSAFVKYDKASKHKGKFKPNKNGVYVMVEDMPEFPGGHMALKEYLENKVKELPAKYHINKRAFVTFVVNKKGKITEARVIKGTDNAEVDKMALKITNDQPKWRPGYQNGKAVKVSYTIPVNFSVE
jgi:TonB family protein